jgi:hypothetical protein
MFSFMSRLFSILDTLVMCVSISKKNKRGKGLK